MASTRPLISCVFAVIEGACPSSLRVAVVTGPMLAALHPSGHGSPSLKKFSAVEELVNVTMSAPRSRKAAWAPATSSVSASVL